jgi:hypothetical protein
VVIVINNSDKQVGLYSGGLIFGGGGHIWNEASVSTCGGLIHGGGLYSGGLYSEVYGTSNAHNFHTLLCPMLHGFTCQEESVGYIFSFQCFQSGKLTFYTPDIDSGTCECTPILEI